MRNNTLVDVSALSKPATVLIKKISAAVGTVFEPHRIVRQARVEAQAEIIRAEADIRVSELQRRAVQRFVEEEGRRQADIESITEQALPLLDADAKPEQVDDDWITNFFEKSRIVSGKEMQALLAKILAGEANSPGTFSKRTINILSDIEKQDVEALVKLRSFCWNIGGLAPLLFSPFRTPIYLQNGLTFDMVSQLESLGLVRVDYLSGFTRMKVPKNVQVSYFDRNLTLTLPLDADNEVQTGNVLLSRVGAELLSACSSEPIEEFFDWTKARWIGEGLLAGQNT